MPYVGRGIKIDNKHTSADWGLIPTTIEIGLPEPKTINIDIPGGNGSIDLTEALTGEIAYTDRAGQFEFDVTDFYKKWPGLVSEIAAFCHGKKCRVVLPNDPDWFYISRITVNSFKSNRTIGKLVMSVRSEPYKYKINPTVYRIVSKGEPYLLTCHNSRKRVIPTFTASDNCTIVFLGHWFGLVPGSPIKHPGITFHEGQNHLKIIAKANTVITVEYQEGGF